MSSSLTGRRIALVGGAGFIGHNLALALKRKGGEVSVIDGLEVNNVLEFHNAPDGKPNGHVYVEFIAQRLAQLREAEIPLYVQDARDHRALWDVLTRVNPQVIVHLAAVSHAGRSNKDPHTTFDHSLRTLENSLEWAKKSAEHFIYFSSSMAYGNFQTAEVDENHPLNPIGIYGALKVAGEKLVIAHQQVFDLPYTIIRPSALYGPRCVSRRVGQIYIEDALRGHPLRIDGDGKERLDFTFVEDLAEGVALAIEKPQARNQIFNMTYGSSRSIADLADIVTEHFPGVERQYVKRDKLMPFRGTLSVHKAREMLGYDPKNPIEIGFPKYIAWYREFFEGLGAPRKHNGQLVGV
jgi:nucleoside-diphosphate-sugar epimerase